MSETRRVCAYWVLVNTTPDEDTANYDYRCVAAQSRFTGHEWSVDEISCFNEDPDLEEYGLCDGTGGLETCWACTKYSPGGIAFGVFDPETQGYRLPFIFEVYNLRAKMGKCCYWDSSTSDDYEVNQTNGQIDKVTNRCSKGLEAQEWNDPDQPTGPTAASGILFDIPCNGVKAECDFYTGPPWEYCVDDKMQTGDRILAQQIQELRYYAEDWDYYDNPIEIFKGKYQDPELYAWHGTFMYQDPTTKQLEEEVELAEFGTQNFPVLDKVELEQLSGTFRFSGEITSKKILPAGGTPSKDGPPNYPTLIKALNDSVKYRPSVHFPYNDYIHKHWTDNGNKVTVIGTSNGATNIYVVNGNLVENVPKSAINYKLTAEATGDILTEEQQEAFNSYIDTFILQLLWYDPENLYEITPSETSGYFKIEDVELEVGESQTLYVFSLGAAGDWSVITVRVHDYFYHMFIQQTNFYQKWWKDNHLGTGAHIEGSFAHMSSRNNIDASLSFSPTTSVENFYWRNYEETGGLIGTPLQRYSYYVVEVDVDEYTVPEDDWKIISTCGETLVKIDDINLNRPYGWKIESAQITGYLPDGTEVSFGLEEDYPSDLSDLSENFPPNYVILTPEDGEDPKWLRSSDAELKIKYKYYKEKSGPLNLEENETLVTPTGTGYLIESAPMGITYTDSEFALTETAERTMAFRANVADEDGRIVGIKNQKMLLQYDKVLCRDYEIEYRWLADYKQYQWYPTNWIMFLERIPFETQYVGDAVKRMTPTCGDHDLPPQGLIVYGYDIVGPMWYPYTECDDDIYYQVATVGNICNLPVEGYLDGTRDATHHRNRAPDEAYPETFGDPHPAIFVCKNEYDYGYSDKSSANIFTGAGNARGEVDLTEYIAQEWAYPKFGNVLREQCWINRCTDYINYYDYQINVMGYEWKWVPVLEEWSDEYDLFSEEILHPFMFMQANIVSGREINEYEDETRYKYSEIIKSKRNSQIQYPSDFIYYQYIGDSLFDSEATQWVYRERWKDIERTTNNDDKITCASLSYPDYAWGYETARVRDEYQKTADEGEHTFIFSPPEYEENGDIKTDAYFRILPGPPRYIDLTTMTWKDTEAWVNGEKIEPVYKYWNGGSGDWDSEPELWTETISTGDESEAQSKGNYYKTYDDQTMEESEHYYFKGVNISLRNSYFPYYISSQLNGTEYDTILKLDDTTGHNERNLGAPGDWKAYSGGRLNPHNATPSNIDSTSLEWVPSRGPDAKVLTFDIGQGISVYEFEIKYYEGPHQDDLGLGDGTRTYVGIFPGCNIYGSKNESDWEFISSIDSVDYETAAERNQAIQTILSETREPTSENLAQKYRYYKFEFGTWSETDAVFQLRTVGFKPMAMEQRSEVIKLYERRYYRTRGKSYDFAMHGTESYSTWLSDDAKSTIYLDDSRIRGIVGDGGFEVVHKCRSRGGGERYIDNDPRDYGGPGSDITYLEEKQENLFTTAASYLSGDGEFRLVLHSAYNEYLESFGMAYPETVCILYSVVPNLSEIFGEVPNSGDVWAAAGHRYVNDKDLTHQEICGGIPSPWSFRRLAWTTDYCFMHYDHAGGGCEEGTSPIIIYTAGVASPTLIGGQLPGTVIVV